MTERDVEMNEKLLKEYVASVLTEGGYWIDRTEDDRPKKKGPGFIEKIKSFFSGSSKPDAVSSEWLEDQELYYDVKLSDEFETDVKKFVRDKWPLATRRAKGDDDRAEALMKKALDSRYKQKLRELERQLSSLEDDEEI